MEDLFISNVNIDEELMDELWNMKPGQLHVVCHRFEPHNLTKVKTNRYTRDYGCIPTDSETSYMSGQSCGNIPDILLPLKQMVEEKTGREYNQCTINWYPDAYSGIRQHTDLHEGNLDVAVVNFDDGIVTGKFVVKNIKSRKKTEIPMSNGMLIGMFDDFQDKYTHGVQGSECPGTKKSRMVSVCFRRY